MTNPLEIVQEQAEDDGLWFNAETAPEAYLQQELRRLHAAVERTSAAPQAPGIHSCSYYCERPECIKRQRDELRDAAPVAQTADARAQEHLKACKAACIQLAEEKQTLLTACNAACIQLAEEKQTLLTALLTVLEDLLPYAEACIGPTGRLNPPGDSVITAAHAAIAAIQREGEK